MTSELSTATEDLCRFLSACYYEPAEAFAEEELFESMLAAAQQLHPELAAGAQRLGAAFAAQDLQTLLIDYTRLFIGPAQPLARPYGAVWLSTESSMMQESTMAVQALYGEGGFDLDESFRDLPDHVAVELEFLYLLLFRIHRAPAQGSEAKDLHAANAEVTLGDDENEEPADLDLAQLLALRRKFLAEHLGRWIGPFTAAVVAGAQTDFYRELGTLTERFVRLQEAAASTQH